MSPRPTTRGSGLLELLVGTAIGMGVLGLLTGAIATGARVLTVAAARGELEDIAHIAVESLAFDVRRAGYDPVATGVTAVTEAYADHVILAADLGGDGTVAADSEETIAYVCSTANRRLSRIVGRQSLPVADGVRTCRLRYLDAAGSVLPVTATGLSAADRGRVRTIVLDLVLAAPGLTMPTARTIVVSLRTPA